MKTKLYTIISGVFILLMTSCTKDWLEEKPSKSLVVPQTIKDLQAVLDDPYTLNRGMPTAGLISVDLLNISDADLGQFQESDRNIYSYTPGYIWAAESTIDWDQAWKAIASANIVLEGITKLNNNDPEVLNLKGQAYFFRAFHYYNLAQIFCAPYEASKAAQLLGLPIRTTSDVNILEKRSTLSELYSQIIKDLQSSSALLPASGKNFFRPTKPAALAMLSKISLLMQDFNKARVYADSAITIKPELLDYNNSTLVSSSKPYIFPDMGVYNPEIILYAFGNLTWFDGSGIGSPIRVKQSLYESYESNDLRKTFLYETTTGQPSSFGTYSGYNNIFQGISTNLLYFIRSECNARLGNLDAAKNDLNLIFKYRYKTGTAPVVSESNKDALIRLILSERTKEFPRVSNIWWEDLRRLNLEPAYQRTMSRTVNNKLYTLPPNDPRYVFPIPNNEIKLSGIEQNQR